MTADRNGQVVLARRPEGRLQIDDFALATAAMPEPAHGEVLVRVLYAIVAPGQRAFMQGATFRDGLQVGEVIPGQAVAEVVACPDSSLAPGDLVDCWAGWQEHAVLPVSGVRPLGAPRLPLPDYVGLLGPNGLMAYFGVLDVGQVSSGQTVVVSAAAGGVGHIAGQLARIAGARVVGIAGGAAKGRVLVDRLGFDAGVDRRAPDFATRLSDACPDGVDVFFDNVAGAVMEAVLPVMNVHGRIVCCGSVADYDSAEQYAPGPRGLSLMTVTKRLTLQGVLVADFQDSWPDATERLIAWKQAGALHTLATTRRGLASAPGALVDLLAGRTLGQTAVQINRNDVHTDSGSTDSRSEP